MQNSLMNLGPPGVTHLNGSQHGVHRYSLDATGNQFNGTRDRIVRK
ncbi:hypothetical protein J7J49_15010 [Halomonas sp. ISL-56]|nr:hypothetical protein [Halomonas sp. ISL-56]MBT2802633.1 hypothetical protein [Halomonas sp. ISL-56]